MKSKKEVRGNAYFLDRDRVFDYIKSHKEQVNYRIADKIVEKTFLFDQPWDMEKCFDEISFEKEIDWTYVHNNDREWMWMLNRQHYYLPVMQAYIATGDKKYVNAVLAQMEHWIDTQINPQGKAYTTWRTLDVGLRLKNWIKILEYVMDLGVLSNELFLKIKGSIHSQISYLMKSYKKEYALTNWRILEFHGTFIASVYFREFEESDDWIEKSLEILEECIRLQVMNDGFHWEQSYMYHVEMLLCMSEVLLIADRNQIAVSENIRSITKKMADAMTHMVTPGGTQLCYGDSDAESIKELMGGMALLFDNSIYKYFAVEELNINLVCDYGILALEQWDKIEAKAPTQLDYEHGDVGNYFARSGWGKEDSYLFFKNGFIGSGHGHCDLLHFEIISKGKPILVDSGRYTYRDDTPDRQRFKSAAAHNTFLIDSEEFIIQEGSWDNLKLATAIKRPSVLNREVCYLQGAHLGYIEKGIFVNRKIIYIKPNIWIIVDESFAKGQHTYEQFFHFAKTGVKLDKNEVIYEDESQKFRLFVSDGSRTELRTTERSLGYNQRYTAESIVITTESNNDTVLPIICIAEEQEESYTVEIIQVLDMNRDAADKSCVSAWKISKGNEKWIILINHKEENHPRRQLYIVENQYVYARAVVFYEKNGENKEYILEY